MKPVSIDTLSQKKPTIDQAISLIAQGNFDAAQENFIKAVGGYIKNRLDVRWGDFFRTPSHLLVAYL